VNRAQQRWFEGCLGGATEQDLFTGKTAETNLEAERLGEQLDDAGACGD